MTNQKEGFDVKSVAPADTQTMHSIATAIAKQDFRKARNDIDQVLKQEPVSIGNLVFMGKFLEAMGDFDESLKLTLLAIVLEIQDPSWLGAYYRQVASLLYKKGRKMDAEQVLRSTWERVKLLYPSHTQEEERKKYFRLFDE